jgi:hypothetical protein
MRAKAHSSLIEVNYSSQLENSNLGCERLDRGRAASPLRPEKREAFMKALVEQGLLPNEQPLTDQRSAGHRPKAWDNHNRPCRASNYFG